MQGKITRDQAKWILASYEPIRGYGKIGNHQGVILEALGLMRGNPVHMGCNCELPALARICSDMFDQNREEIEAIANKEVIENESDQAGI
jgi:hypothetical protein